MDDIALEAMNAEAISRAHEKYLTPPAERPTIVEMIEAESTMTASEAMFWAKKVYGSDGTINTWNGVRKVGFLDGKGYMVVTGFGLTWDTAVRMAGGPEEETEEIRLRGQG